MTMRARLARLEGRSVDLGDATFIVTGVPRAGDVDAGPVCAATAAGWIGREAGEPEEAFKLRALARRRGARP